MFIGLGLFVSFTAISLKVCNQRCLWTTWQQMETKNKVILLAAVVYLPLAVKCVAALLVYAVRLVFDIRLLLYFLSMLHWISWQGDRFQAVIATDPCGGVT